MGQPDLESLYPLKIAERRFHGQTVGEYGYSAGSAGGTVSVPADARVLDICGCAVSSPGTITIAGGVSIPVETDKSFATSPLGNVAGPVDIVFSATMNYFVSWVTGGLTPLP